MSGAGQTTIGSGGTLSMSGPRHVLLQRLLVNEGTATWTAGDFEMNGGTFQNNGSFTANSDGNLESFGYRAVAACSTTPARSPSWARASRVLN